MDMNTYARTNIAPGFAFEVTSKTNISVSCLIKIMPRVTGD